MGEDEGDEEDRSTIHGLVRDADGAKGEDGLREAVGNVENPPEPKQHGGHAGITISATLPPET
jgi:hypothetical protein